MSRRVFAIAGLILLAGCGLTNQQRDAATRLGNASEQIGDAASDEFLKLRDTAIAMNKIDVEIGGSRDYKELDKNFDAKTIAVRVQAAQALASYGKLLTALVTATEADQLKTAANDFVSSVKGISGKKLSDSQLEALGSIVQEIGSWIVECKKAKALEKIVPEAAPQVDQLCDLLIEDFSANDLHLAQGADATILRLRGDIDVALADKHAPFAERAAAVEGEMLADDADARLKLVDAQTVESLKKLKCANAQLVLALSNKEYDLADIEQLGKQMKELASSIKTLSGR